MPMRMLMVPAFLLWLRRSLSSPSAPQLDPNKEESYGYGYGPPVDFTLRLRCCLGRCCLERCCPSLPNLNVY